MRGVTANLVRPGGMIGPPIEPTRLNDKQARTRMCRGNPCRQSSAPAADARSAAPPFSCYLESDGGAAT